MAYTKQTWHDMPTTDTPIDATHLGVLEQGVFDASTAAATALAAGAGLQAYADAKAITGVTATLTTTATATVGKLHPVDATSAPFTVTLPSPVGIAGSQMAFRKLDVSVNAVTLSGLIDGGSSTLVLAGLLTGQSAELLSDGTTWRTKRLPLADLSGIYAPAGLPAYATILARFDPARSSYNNRASGKRNWSAALAKSRTTVSTFARLAVVGTSITEGFNAGAHERLGFAAQVRFQLAAMLGNSGTGIIPVYESTLESDPRVTYPGGAWTDVSGAGTVVGLAGSHGRTTHNVALTAVVKPVGGPLQGGGGDAYPVDGFNVWYMNGPTAAPFTIAVDSGGPQTVTPTTGAVTVGMATIAAVTNGPRTLTITAPAAGDLTWVAWEGYVGTSGVRVSQLGSFGATAAVFTNAASLDFLFGAAMPKHDVMFFEFGTNEMNNNIDPAVFKTNLQTLISAQLAAGGDAVLIVPPPCGAAGKTYTVGQYATALYQLADTNNIAIIDLLDRWGSYAAANTAGLMSDTLHPNQAGHDEMANAIMEMLPPRPFVVPTPLAQFNTGRGGVGNTAAGVDVLALAKADQNTAVGYQALKASTTASQNTAIGYKALGTTATGGGNTAVGLQCLQLATGVSNTAMGVNCAQSVTTGTNNVAIGVQALFGATTALNNVAVGHFAGATATPANKIVAGQANTFIGYQSGGASGDPSFATAIGYNALAVTGAVAVGSAATATGLGSIAIGRDSAGTSATSTVNNLASVGTALTSLQVGDPGGGQGAWMLGKVTTATSALDTTRYVQVKIDGTVVKLAVCS